MARGCEQPSPILQRRYCVMPQHLNRVRIALTRIVLRRGNRPIFFFWCFFDQVMAKTDTDLRPRSGRLIRTSERSGRQGSGCGAFQFLRPQQMRLRVVLQVCTLAIIISWKFKASPTSYFQAIFSGSSSVLQCSAKAYLPAARPGSPARVHVGDSLSAPCRSP